MIRKTKQLKNFFSLIILCGTILLSACGGDSTGGGSGNTAGAPTVPASNEALFPSDNAANVSANGLVLTWGAFSGEENLVLQIDTDSTFPGASVSALILEEVSIASGQTSYTVPDGLLQGETNYFWRLIARNSNGDQLYGPFSFTTAATCTPTTEVCDGVDNDCDGQIDEGVIPANFFADADGDGFGVSTQTPNSAGSCNPPVGFAANSIDCDDNDGANFPGNSETCDGQDNNCNSQVDEGVIPTNFFADADGDGFGVSTPTPNTANNCSAPSGFVSNSNDCDDGNAGVHPNVAEVCGDTIDNDCNGLVDDGFPDTDGDSQLDCVDTDDDNDSVVDGNDTDPLNPRVCQDLEGDNCDDCAGNPISSSSPNTAPGWSLYTPDPLNDGTDTEGDGLCDSGDPDDDNDGVNDSSDSAPFDPQVCQDLDGDSCNDCSNNSVSSSSPNTFPGWPLYTPTVSNDGTDTEGDGICDVTDPDDDNDGDADAVDCAPLDSTIFSGAAEVCDGIDNNCVGGIDEGFTNTDGDAQADCIDLDDDNDNDPDVSDCAPLDNSIFTGALEIADDGIDQDCNLADTITCNSDVDQDGFGPFPVVPILATDGICTNDPGEVFIGNTTDCDDSNSSVSPFATEICDGIDNNCQNGIDEGFSDADSDGSADCADPDLAGLTLSSGEITPLFDPDTTQYNQVSVGFLVDEITVTPGSVNAMATVTVNGIAATPGNPSQPISLTAGVVTNITVEVTSAAGTARTYQVPVRRDAVAEFAQQAYAKASNTNLNDKFGSAVDLDGDTLVIAANREQSDATGINGNQSDNNANHAGAVYVFVRNGTTWTQQAYLKASNTEQNDHFGRSVAISGDTIVVGADDEDSNAVGATPDHTTALDSTGAAATDSATDSGAAYVFVRNGTTWTQQAYLKASNTEQNDGFGKSVAIDGNTIVISAKEEDSNAIGTTPDHTTAVDSTGMAATESANNSGAAYVFVRNGTTWTQQAYLKSFNTGPSDSFGSSVGISDDTIVVGAFGESNPVGGINNGNEQNNGASFAGAAYVFVRNGTTWTQQAYLKASNPTALDSFGVFVDINGETVIVSAIDEDSNAVGATLDHTTAVDNTGAAANDSATDSGAVYVFVRNGTTWTQQAYLKASNTGLSPSQRFGSSIAIDGNRIIVGARQDDSQATGINGDETDTSADDSGAVYLFVRSGTIWTQQAYIKASNTEANDSFGGDSASFDNDRIIAISGDTIVVGATGESSNAVGITPDHTTALNSAGAAATDSALFSGAAYIFQ